jgi:hypothetical protein
MNADIVSSEISKRVGKAPSLDRSRKYAIGSGWTVKLEGASSICIILETNSLDVILIAPDGFVVLEFFILGVDAVEGVEWAYSPTGYFAFLGLASELDFALFLLREVLGSGWNAGGAVVSEDMNGFPLVTALL